MYDYVIIGSGLGGLISAVILAKEGKKVCVLEKNNQYGGNLQTFVREKVIFDTGVHYIGSLGKDEILYKYFKYVGIIDDLKLNQLDIKGYDRICFGDDPIEYPHAQGYENFIEQLLPYFPEEEKTLQIYCETLKEMCNAFPLYRLDNNSEYNQENLSINCKKFIENLTSNKKLQSILLGTNILYAGTYEHTPLYVHALSINSYIESAWKCMLGGSQITKLLIQQLRKYNADVFKHQEVSSFTFDENRKIKSVITKQGKEFFAQNFISNIDIKTTIKLAGEEHFKKAYRNRISQLRPVIGIFSVYLKIKPNTLPYLNYNIYWHRNIDSVWITEDKNSAEFFPESFMISMSPPKKDTSFTDNISLLTYMNYNEVKKWENTFNTKTNINERGEDYELFKKEKAEKMMAILEKRFPNIRECIDGIYTSTPLTYRDYIGSFEGNAYGYDKDANSPMASFFTPQTHIKNLFVTGQTVNMHGILGVTIGAVRTCGHLLGKEYLMDKIKNETC